MEEDRSPLEVALDLFVYAPFGVFLALTEELPQLVDKGRQRLDSQLMTARVMGEMAAPQLQQEAGKLFRGLVDRLTPPGPPPHAETTPTAPSSAPAGAPTSGTEGGGSTGVGGAEDATGSSPVPVRSVGEAGVATTPSPSAGPIPAEASLAIPGYDSLSAMQVVQRLAGLSATELEAVRRYEEGHRGRKTIINRADQLRAEAG